MRLAGSQIFGTLGERLRHRSAGFAAVGAAAMLIAAVMVVQSAPRSELDVHLSDGAVWLPSTAIGGVSLLDGGSGTIAASLGVADPGDDFAVEQFGSDAVIVNQTDGTVARLDGASWTIATGRVQFGVPGEPLHVVTGDATGWMMTPGQATTLEMEELAVRTPIPVAAPFADGIITSSGALLYASSDPELPVQRFDVGKEPAPVDDLDGPTALIHLGDTVAAVDLDDHSVWLEGEGVVCRELEFPADAELSAGGGEDHLIVVSDQGGAFVWDPSEVGCPGANAFINLGPGMYGEPALTDDWAVVPEISTGSVLVIDLDAMSVTNRQELEGVEAGTEVSLIAEDGAIWYNDPGSARAGLIRRDGTIIPIAKYEDGATGFTSAPVDDAAQDADDVSIAGAQDEQQVEEEAPEAEAVAGPELTTTTLAGDENGTNEPDQTENTTATTEPQTGGTSDTTDPDDTTPDDTTDTTDPDGTTDTTDGGDPGVGEPGEGTSTTSTPEVDPVLKITLGVSALSVVEGDSITFTAITQHGNPNNYSITISPQGPPSLPIDEFGVFSVLFPNPGRFVVALTACDPEGNCDTAQTRVTIVTDPDAIPLVAAIDGPTSVLVGETASFRDISQGDPDTWSWATDGAAPASGTSDSIAVSWPTPGPRTLSLRVGRGSSTKITTFDVDVTEATPPAPFGLTCSPSSLEIGSTASCQLAGDVADFSGISFSTSADGQAGFTSNSPSAGQFRLSSTQERTVTISLTATDDGTGEAVSATATVGFTEVICPAVVPSVTVSGPGSLEVNTAGNFSSTTTGGCGTETYSWTTTGGGSVSNPTGSSTNVTWSSAGTYTVTLSYSDGSGSDSASRTVTVDEPVAGPSAPSISVSGASALDTSASGSFSASNSGGPINTYAWSTNGGGGSASSATFNASWNSAGIYTVTLLATGPGGSDTATYSVTVADPPPQPSPFGMTCDLASQQVEFMINCDLTTGNQADFSNPVWTVGPASANYWLMNIWSMDVAGTVIGSTVTVKLSATDLATGLTVTADDSIGITAPPVPALGLTCSPTTRPADGTTAATCSVTNPGEFGSVSFSSNQPSANMWGAPGQFFIAWDQVGTASVSASAVHTASGTTVTAGPIGITFEAVAPPPPTPAPMTIACSLVSQQRARCSLTSGNSGSFSGPSWAVTGTGSLSWGRGPFEVDAGSTIAGGSVSVSLTATDIATGQIVSAGTSITIPEAS